MAERMLKIETPDGVMETFLALPDGPSLFPPVVLYMDFWGMREQIRDIARFVATNGFACAAPNLYYRAGGDHFDHRNEDGRSKSIAEVGAEDRKKMLDYSNHLTDDMVVSDTASLMSALHKVDGVKHGYAGCFGYCMGGRHVVRVAAALPAIFRATASFHGTALVKDAPDSPHRSASNIQGEIYFGFGEADPFTPPDVIAAVRAAFDAAPAAATYKIHAATHHGYAIPDRDVFSADATNEDWTAVFAMFRRML